MKRKLFRLTTAILSIMFLFFTPAVIVACDDYKLPKQLTHTHEEMEGGAVCEACGWKKSEGLYNKKDLNAYCMCGEEGAYTVEFFGESVSKSGALDTFYTNNHLKGVFISKNVKSIGVQAFFHCEELEYVVFEEASTLKNIGSQAFYGCRNLKKITIPASVEKIESDAFSNCGTGCWGMKGIEITYEQKAEA